MPVAETPGFDHPAFAGISASGSADEPPGVPLEQTQPTDQQKLAVVLQGAAVLSLLERSGWFLPGGFDSARLRDNGLLSLDAPRRGRAVELPQTLLARLLTRLFGSGGRMAGRGQARAAARYLYDRWQQILVPMSCERTVTAILEAAPFLWKPAFGEARATLAAAYRDETGSRFLLVAPSSVARRFRSRAADLAELRALLAGPLAWDLWEGFDPEADPVELAALGRRKQAVAHWRRQPPRDALQKLNHARTLIALGRFAEAKKVLGKRQDAPSRILRIHCQIQLNELPAARAALRSLADRELSRDQTLELAENAVRLLGRLGDREASRDWVARAARAGAGKNGGPRRWKADLVAAEAAWDAANYPVMHECLEAAAEARKDPELAPRWHKVRALQAIGIRDGQAAVLHTTIALGARRSMGRAEAGRHFSDLAYGRVLAGDLAGAERACQHAVRLLGGCEGPSHDTLALYNLAAIRLRRGRLTGVPEALEVSMAENRQTNNRRALLSDFELWVRLALVEGQPEVALTRIAETQHLLEPGHEAEGDVFELLAARAHGWLAQPAAAAACLARTRPAALRELEPEERSALLALAGDLKGAAAEAEYTPWAELWSALAGGLPPSPIAFTELERLEPYRAARLIYDLETVRPGTSPAAWLRRAAASLRAVGAKDQAERLEGGSQSPWRAVERFLKAPPDELEAIAELFRDAGFTDVRLSLERGGREEMLLGGPGGPESYSLILGDSRWLLRAPTIDQVLRALLALVARDLGRRRPSLPRTGAPASADKSDDASGIIGESAALRQAISRADRLASRRMPILVLGESGTGKELFARRIHDLSARAAGPFLAVNCAALSANLIQSELFGHVKGAFTGADRDRSGIFEAARTGTVFLDEIGDLPPEAQGKLLRVLQEGEIQRLGESLARKVDVRIVAATHRDLARMVTQKLFRGDLFYRLKVGTIDLPPLRERERDVLLLAQYFLARLNEKGQTPPRLTPEAEARILGHSWPGNVRELENTLEAAAALADGMDIRPEDLELPEAGSPRLGDYHQMIERYRKKLITEALAASGGNRSGAARRLGLSRQALSYMVRNLKLDT